MREQADKCHSEVKTGPAIVRKEMSKMHAYDLLLKDKEVHLCTFCLFVTTFKNLLLIPQHELTLV
jgi:hypothetical protein